MAKALFEKGVSVSVTSTTQGILPEHSIAPGKWMNQGYGEVIYVPTSIHYLPLRLLFTTIKQMHKADIIHLTAIFYPLSWLTALINNLFFRKPVVWSPRGELDPPALMYSTYKKKTVLLLIQRLILPFGHFTFHATCEAELRYIQNIFSKRYETILLPNYMELPTPVSSEKDSFFLYIGRIHPKKAIENLIQALAISQLFKSSGFRLIVAGDCENEYGGKLKDLTRQLDLNRQVSFMGHIAGEAKQELLAKAYFSFMPSHSENFGNVVVEALSQGTPVIASKGTPWAALEEFRAGYWIDNDPHALAQIIDTILDMSLEKYERLSFNASRLAQEKFDVHQNIDLWIEVYEKLLQNKLNRA
ncbi:MAG TPA: glycosyltransferase [Saprospiraceae bacterium]|nr:glycosyltransferase [Saprospiraceae bacterium]HMQ85773.1 glycosyltransferase [Saprospiraceae bacterium]